MNQGSTPVVNEDICNIPPSKRVNTDLLRRAKRQTTSQTQSMQTHHTPKMKTTYLKLTTPPISISKTHTPQNLHSCPRSHHNTNPPSPIMSHHPTHALTIHDSKQAQHKSTNPDKPTTHHAFANGRHCQPPHWNPTVSDNTARFSSGARFSIQ